MPDARSTVVLIKNLITIYDIIVQEMAAQVYNVGVNAEPMPNGLFSLAARFYDTPLGYPMQIYALESSNAIDTQMKNVTDAGIDAQMLMIDVAPEVTNNVLSIANYCTSRLTRATDEKDPRADVCRDRYESKITDLIWAQLQLFLLTCVENVNANYEATIDFILDGLRAFQKQSRYFAGTVESARDLGRTTQLVRIRLRAVVYGFRYINFFFF